jgi:hypothetical protein
VLNSKTMKKIYLLLILISVLFSACSGDSSDDPSDLAIGPLVRQATTTSDNSTSILNYFYNGHKITKIVSDTGLTFRFTYSGNLIMTLERVWGEDDVAQRADYTYDANGKLIEDTFSDFDNDWQETHVYTYNTDQTVIQEAYDGTTVSPENYMGKTKRSLNNNGEVTELAAFENGDWVIKTQMTYTSYYSPMRNVVGFNKLMVNGTNYMYATYANINNVDYPQLNESSVFDYTVNALNYPSQCVQTTTRNDGSIYQATIDYTYY